VSALTWGAFVCRHVAMLCHHAALPSLRVGRGCRRGVAASARCMGPWAGMLRAALRARAAQRKRRTLCIGPQSHYA